MNGTAFKTRTETKKFLYMMDAEAWVIRTGGKLVAAHTEERTGRAPIHVYTVEIEELPQDTFDAWLWGGNKEIDLGVGQKPEPLVNCELCGEPGADAEMFPDWFKGRAPHYICHYECGHSRGYIGA